MDSKNGVQSLEIGIGILRAISSGHRAMMLKEIATAADMSASKVHRYLVSLVRCGLVVQDAASSRYDLGPLALSLGLVAVERLDRVKLGMAAIETLRDEIKQTIALAIWSELGPVIVRSVRPNHQISLNLVTGTVLRLLSSACDQVVAAHLPRSVTHGRISHEQANLPLPADLPSADRVDAMLAQVLAEGVATVAGEHQVPGVAAAAAPVFNFKRGIVLAILVKGVKDLIDLSANGTVVTAVTRCAHNLSQRLSQHGGSWAHRQPKKTGGPMVSLYFVKKYAFSPYLTCVSSNYIDSIMRLVTGPFGAGQSRQMPIDRVNSMFQNTALKQCTIPPSSKTSVKTC